MNRGEIFTAVRDYLNRPNLPDDSMVVMMSNAESEMRTFLREHPSNIRRTSMIQPENNAILPLPFDMAQMILLRDSVGTWRQYPADGRDEAAAVGRAYIMRGDCAELFPAQGVETEFFLDYNAHLTTLAGNASTNWVSTYHPDLYLYGMLKEAAVFLKDDQRLASWNQEFMRRIDNVAGQGWNRNISTAPRIRFG